MKKDLLTPIPILGIILIVIGIVINDIWAIVFPVIVISIFLFGQHLERRGNQKIEEIIKKKQG